MLETVTLMAALAAGADRVDLDAPLVGERTTVFRASAVHLGDGRVLDRGVVFVQDGVIREVGVGLEPPDGAHVVDHPGDLSPGLVALHGFEGGGGELVDTTRPILPKADAATAFDPDHPDFGRSLDCGITTVVLSPPATALCPGTTAVVKTSGGTVVRPRAQLVVGLSSTALKSNEFPTSFAGALAALSERLEEPTGAFRAAASGELGLLVKAGTRSQIQRALGFVVEHRLRGALYGSYWAEDLVGEIKASGLSVVCTPSDPGDDARWARSIAALSAAGVRLGFGLDAPGRHPHCLRFGAAVAARGGMTNEAALTALTGDAAAIAGVSDRLGRIDRGLDADLVLWSGDPLDLASEITAVYVDGQRVRGGER
ncbi:MAG: amidohydrolase family protein [Planctomycetota bacterium]|nr:amidohydrolase family protein [Planctomycetota bacterium]MDP6989034.1 amidohydrolase family protein [Planctomycetota bacterium]